MRTPLAAIRAEAELAQSGHEVAEQVRAALGRITETCDAMSVAISTLMDLARAGGGIRHTHLASTLRSLVDARAAGPVRVDLAPVADALVLAVPPDLTARSLAPLLEDAVRHARSRVVVTTSVHDHVVDLHVEDDGPGTGADDLDALFAPGTRGPDSDGAGLGLALARRVARSAGGDVCELDAETGAHFVLTLPRA